MLCVNHPVTVLPQFYQKYSLSAKKETSRRTRTSDNNGDSHPGPVPMVPMVMTPTSPAPPYFKEGPCMLGDRHCQVIVNVDSRYHNVPQRTSVDEESLYIEMK